MAIYPLTSAPPTKMSMMDMTQEACFCLALQRRCRGDTDGQSKCSALTPRDDQCSCRTRRRARCTLKLAARTGDERHRRARSWWPRRGTAWVQRCQRSGVAVSASSHRVPALSDFELDQGRLGRCVKWGMVTDLGALGGVEAVGEVKQGASAFKGVHVAQRRLRGGGCRTTSLGL